MTRVIHYSLVAFLCNIVSVLCIWDVIPCHENYSLNPRVFSWWVIVLIPVHLGTWSRGLCTRPIYQVWFVTLGIYMYFCVFCMVIYLCCSLSSFVLVTHTLSPQYKTEWGPAAQKTGENLKCGPSVKSTSQYPPLLRVGHPGGSLDDRK